MTLEATETQTWRVITEIIVLQLSGQMRGRIFLHKLRRREEMEAKISFSFRLVCVSG